MPTPITGTEDLINEALLRSLDLNIAAETEESASLWTDRALSYAQSAAQEAFEYADWPFRNARQALTITPTGSKDDGDCSVNLYRFAAMGEQGGIYLAGQRKPPLSYANPSDLISARETEGREASRPEIYTIWGGQGTQLLFYPFLTSPVDIAAYYQVQRPDLTYDNPGGLEAFPTEFYEVLLFALEDLLAMGGGDSKSLEQLSPRFRKGINQLKANRVPGREALERIGSRGLRRHRMH